MTQTNLAAALAKAQGEMQNAPLNKVNPHFKSKYADLAAIRDATIPALSKNGLSIVQFTSVVDGATLLHTRLLHTSGEFIESAWPLPHLHDKPQQMGSALTYAKRYSWAAMCGIAADEDDDANAAQSAAPKANGARQAAPKEVEAPQWKQRADAINKAIKTANTTDMVNKIVAANTKDLAEIKANSPTAYEFLMGNAEKRKGQIIAAADAIKSDEEAELMMQRRMAG